MAAKRKKGEQTTFPGLLDGPARTPAVVEFPFDFADKPTGYMAADNCRVVNCPVCSAHCIAQKGARAWRFVHEAVIVSSAKTTKLEPSRSHLLEHEIFDVLVKRGAVLMTRGNVSIKAVFPSLAVKLVSELRGGR